MAEERTEASAAERLRRVFGSGRFVFTGEIDTPGDASVEQIERQAHGYAAYLDAANCVDNSAAKVRISPLAAAAIVAKSSLVPLVQLTCRDRNRIALQSDILGAAVVGAGGIVCMTGDPPGIGNEPNAKTVYDLDTIELIATVNGLREGRLHSGEHVARPPDVLVGAVENPAEGEHSIARFSAKADAGAEFVQTQITFDPEAFAAWMELVRAHGLHERVHILAGITPIRRLSIAQYLHEHVPGVTVPATLFRRLEDAANPGEEGVHAAAEVVRAIRDIPGVAGVHIMSFGWIDGVRQLVDEI